MTANIFDTFCAVPTSEGTHSLTFDEDGNAEFRFNGSESSVAKFGTFVFDTARATVTIHWTRKVVFEEDIGERTDAFVDESETVTVTIVDDRVVSILYGDEEYSRT